jgi:hypothetical protein
MDKSKKLYTMDNVPKNVRLEMKHMVYRGRDKLVKHAVVEADARVVLTRGYIPGNYRHGDLGHVAAPIAIIYQGERHICTIPYCVYEWESAE